jgi:CheY-like chemotaxis protein
MPLRCLLFSSEEGLVAPIWQVLADLGVEGEHCRNAVEAVERVTTQLFQIVITDWDDQPEAGFLLKTAREIKAAHRPLTLAIVREDSHLPLALQAGANSILRKPLAPDQVRDTVRTACQLLRSKMDAVASRPAVAPITTTLATPAAFAAAASAAPAAVPIVPAKTSAPASVTKGVENPFRAGEFLQPASSAPGRHFDTETDTSAAKSEEQAAVAELDPLSELEPMAAAVSADPPDSQIQEGEEEKAATGWSSVKARLEKLAQKPANKPAANPELISYQETHSSETAPEEAKPVDTGQPPAAAESASEAKLFAYMEGESTEEPEPEVANAPSRARKPSAGPK